MLLKRLFRLSLFRFFQILGSFESFLVFIETLGMQALLIIVVVTLKRGKETLHFAEFGNS